MKSASVEDGGNAASLIAIDYIHLHIYMGGTYMIVYDM